jgi:Fe-S-cluster containining protein
MIPDPLEAMRLFYAEADGAIAAAGALCRNCGACCHFETAGHTLYASRLERFYLARTALRSEATEQPPELLAAGLRCPFQSAGGCLARIGRPLGCRLHFCSARNDDFSESWHRELKRLHETTGAPWVYRPLLPFNWRQAAEKP